MAQLNSRGTQTRTRWDYYERSNGYGFVYGSVVSGAIGAYLLNNSGGSAALDIYQVSWSSSIASTGTLSFQLPPLTVVPLAPLDSQLHSIQPDHAVPPGIVGMWSAAPAPYWTVVRYSQPSVGDKIAPVMGSYFLTLPPGWSLSIGLYGSSNPIELSFSIWYQEILDNVAPAP